MEQHYFECQCSDFNHVIRFTFDEEDGEVWLDVRLNYFEPWYKRVWNAIRFVFKRPVAYGHYDVTMVREEDYARLHDLLDRSALVKRKQRLVTATGMLPEKPLLKG
jgi:hypothetical protein